MHMSLIDLEPLSKPLEKLIETIRDGVGYLYKPTHLKNIAEANAKSINTISEAIRNNHDLSIKYQSDVLEIKSPDTDSLADRTARRIVYREMSNQQNIENIFAKTYLELADVKNCSTEPIDRDWMARFVNAAENISDEDIQSLWARILAGEIIKPKFCSLRTLDIVKNMSKSELDDFLEISPYLTTKFLVDEDDISNKKYGKILSLAECGVINSNRAGWMVSVTKEKTIIFYSSEYILLGITKNVSDIKLKLQIYPLTKAGEKLFELSNSKSDKDFFIRCSKHISEKNRNISLSLHRIQKTDINSEIEYDDVNLLETSE